MKIVKLIEDEFPFMYKGTVTFYKKGELFEVIEEKDMKCMGLGYKLRNLRFSVVFEGFSNAKSFEVTRHD